MGRHSSVPASVPAIQRRRFGRGLSTASSLEGPARRLPAPIDLLCDLGVGGVPRPPPDELSRSGRGARHHSGRHGATVAVDASLLVPACVRPPTTRCPSDVIAAGAAASCSPVACEYALGTGHSGGIARLSARGAPGWHPGARRAAYPPSQRGASLPFGAGPHAPARWERQAILAGAGS